MSRPLEGENHFKRADNWGEKIVLKEQTTGDRKREKIV